MVKSGAIRSRLETPKHRSETYVLAHTGSFASFASHIALFAMRVLGQWSEYSEKPWCPHHFILFFYSDLTAAFTCSVLAHLMDGWPFEPEFELASIRFSRRQPQPPWSLKEGRVVNSPAAVQAVNHYH